MPTEVSIKRFISTSLNPDRTMDMVIETEDNKILTIKGMYPITSKDEKLVTLNFNAKKLDNPINKKQSNFLNFLKTI